MRIREFLLICLFVLMTIWSMIFGIPYKYMFVSPYEHPITFNYEPPVVGKNVRSTSNGIWVIDHPGHMRVRAIPECTSRGMATYAKIDSGARVCFKF